MVHLYTAFIQNALQCVLYLPIHTLTAKETMQGTNLLINAGVDIHSILGVPRAHTF